MKKHILLVDDNKDDLKTFVKALNEVPGVPFKCTYANDPGQAHEMLRYLVPDFIFVDFAIPRIQGLDFLVGLRREKKWQRVKIFLYTAAVSEEMNKMAELLGAAGCIRKTNAIPVLAGELQAILDPGYSGPILFSKGNNN